MKKKLLTFVLLVSSLTLLLSACGEKKTNAAYEYKEFTIGQYTFRTTSARGVALVDADQSITYANLSSTLSYQDITYTLTSIGEYAFEECSALTSVTIPNSVTSIGRSAFGECTLLTSVTIPNSVTSIGERAFEGAALYNNPANWENGALYINDCLVKVDEGFVGHFRIKENTRVIAEYAFEDCSALTSVTIPNSVASIGDGAFDCCSSLTSMVVASGNNTYDSRDNCNAIIETATNTLIAGCQNTTIPNSVTSIGYRAFEDCSSLTSVTIPNSVTSIGYGAFSYCSSLTSVRIPNSVTSIEWQAFKDCSSLTSVNIPNSVTSIGEWAFDGTALYKNPANWENGALYIDNCLIEVDEGFSGHFRIKENTRVIAGGAFNDCSALTSVTIPNSVTSIGESAFWGCSSLTSVTIPNSVTSIGYEAFRGCSALTSVTIPNSVTSIENGMFEGCSALTSVTIPNSVTNIENRAFRYCSSLTSVTIPNSVTSIGRSAFWGCTSLKSVTIPNSVKEIGEEAFDEHTKVIRY